MLDLLIVVNPDREARRRFLELIKGGIEESTVIREYETLADLYWVLERHTPRAGLGSVSAESVWSTVNPVARLALMRLTEDLFEENLTERERKLLVLYYGLDEGEALTPEQIGELLGVSAAEIEETREAALQKLLARH